LVSQVFTLYTTPVIYLCLDRLNNWISGRRRPPREQPAFRDRSGVAGNLDPACDAKTPGAA
jgi:hypothetical protein